MEKKERGHLKDLCIDGRMLLEWMINTLDEKVWIGLIWLRIGTSGGLFHT
jgi:hypothetical protein